MTTQRQQEDIKKTARTDLQSSGASSSSSTTTYHTEPGVSACDLEVIRQYYERILRCYLNAFTAADIEQAINAGLKTSAILDALDETAMAPRPSHYYFRAILKRYMVEGITTREQAEEQRMRRRHERAMARMNRENAWYSSPMDVTEWYGGDQA